MRATAHCSVNSSRPQKKPLSRRAQQAERADHGRAIGGNVRNAVLYRPHDGLYRRAIYTLTQVHPGIQEQESSSDIRFRQ